MTSGTQLDDWDGTAANGTKFGYYRKRTWAGADRNSAIDGLRTEHGYQCSVVEKEMTRINYRILGSYYDSSQGLFLPALPKLSGFPENEATMKVQRQLLQSKFNYGVFAGEFRETVRMIGGMFDALAGSIRLARKGKFRRASQTLFGHRGKSIPGGLANNWLSYTYGLKPFLNDIMSFYELLLSTYEVVHKVRATVRVPYEGAYTLTGVRWAYKADSICQIRGTVRAKVSLADRVGLTDPYSIAWELTRLSFVLDWVLPIQNFLAACNASRMTEGSEFFVTKCNKERLDKPTNTNPEWFYGYDVPKDDYSDYVVVYRLGMTALPWKFPSIQNPLGDSYGRILSGAALLRQAFH